MMKTRNCISWLWNATKGFRIPIAGNSLTGILHAGVSLLFVFACKQVIDAVTGEADHHLNACIGGMLACMAVQLLLSGLRSRIGSGIEIKMRNRMNSLLFNRLMESRWIERGDWHTGDMINRLEEDVPTVSDALCREVPFIIVTLAQLTGALFFLSRLDARLTGILLFIILSILLYKTRFGLRLCACGEHPQAADSVGINVYKMRYAGVLISGALGGLGGLVYITAGVSEWKFETGVAGFGFLALAVMIFGQWKPINIALAALLFGLFRALSNVYTGFDALVALNLPSTVYNMLPYIISLIVLVFVSGKSKAPKAEGIPYDKGQR